MMNWLLAAWRGRLPLWLTYWLLGVAGNMSFLAALVLIFVISCGEAAAVLWIVYGCSLAWFIFIFGAIWRAAGVYPGRPLWPLLARIGVLIGIVRMSVEALLLTNLSALATRLGDWCL
jgi:hypothetical protein